MTPPEEDTTDEPGRVLKFHTPPPEQKPDIFVEIDGEYGPRHAKAGEPWVERFRLIDEMPAGLEQHWLLTATPGRRRTKYEMGPIITFLGLLFGDDGHDRFLALCNDPVRLVRAELLVDIMFQSVEAISGRPTGPASSSSPGVGETETGSQPEPDGPESTTTD